MSAPDFTKQAREIVHACHNEDRVPISVEGMCFLIARVSSALAAAYAQGTQAVAGDAAGIEERAEKVVDVWMETDCSETVHPGSCCSIELECGRQLERAVAAFGRSERAAGRKAALEEAAGVAGRTVCRLDSLPCDGRAREGSACACFFGSNIARCIRALAAGRTQTGGGS